MYQVKRKYQLKCPYCISTHVQQGGKIFCPDCNREFVPPYHPTPICWTDVPMDLVVKMEGKNGSAAMVIPWEDGEYFMSHREYPLNLFNKLSVEGAVITLDGDRSLVTYKGIGGVKRFEGDEVYIRIDSATAEEAR